MPNQSHRYYKLHLDECKTVISKMIEQAVRDYLGLEYSPAPIERTYFQTSKDFLFDDSYLIDWGGVDRSLRDFLDVLDINIIWFREQIYKQKRVRDKEQFRKRLLYNDNPIKLPSSGNRKS